MKGRILMILALVVTAIAVGLITGVIQVKPLERKEQGDTA